MRKLPAVVAGVVLAGVATAQLFPATPRSGVVYDGAHLLTPTDVATIQALSRDFQRDTGAPIVVATLPSLESVGARSLGIERYSTALFDQWRIGNRNANGGILLVVARQDRKARIELGKDWKHDYDAGARRVMQTTLVPAFRSGDYGGGIVRGCQALARLADGTSSASNDTATVTPRFDEGSSRSFPDDAMAEPSGESGFPGGLFCVGVPLLLIVVAVAKLRGRRDPRVRSRGGWQVPREDGFAQSVDREDDAFLTGMMVGQAMSPPPYDPGPVYDPGPSADSGSGFDSGGSSDSGGSFDSGSSGGGGDTGSW